MAVNDFSSVLFRTKATMKPASRHHSRRLRLPLALAAFSIIAANALYSTATPEPPSGAVLTSATASVAADENGKDQKSGETTEDQLKQMLVGKQLFLRGAYLDDSLSFNEHGVALGHPAVGSFTLSAIEIDKVRLTKHKVELTGARYGLHFLGALPNEDPSSAVDRVKITPKKKVLKITIDRELVVKAKKEKVAKGGKNRQEAAQQPNALPVASSETDVVTAAQPSSANTSPATSEANAAQAKPDADTEAGKDEQAADPNSQTRTTSPAHAAQVLRDALSHVLASNLDDDVKGHMPDFWQLYFKAQAARVDYRPSDPNVLRSNAVDQQAKLTTVVAPDSNEFAQANGIAGQALYRVVVGADGQPGEIAVERPIGFGLDENAVAAIRKAAFTPAQKSGKPVPEALDLAVVFRIYSKRTSGTSGDSAGEAKPAEPVKPGPYTAQEPH